MAYDLSTYEGRQEARDAGNWVGADSSGNIVMESGYTGGDASPGGGGGGAPAPTGGGGTQTYQTVNGPRTTQQMEQELRNAGWGGGEDVATAYARTTGGPATAAPQQNTTYTNLDQYNKEFSNAYTAAQTAYLQSKMRLEADDLAFRKAQQAFSESLSRAQMLGTFEGQQTLPAQKQAADIAAQAAGFTGTFGGAPTMASAALSGLWQGAPTLAAQGQYFNQGLALQTQNQKTVQDYLTLLSQLRGPQDYGQYLRTMASTPQGLRDLVNIAGGQQAAAFGTTGVPTQGVTLPGFMAQAGGGAPVPGQAPVGGTSYDEYMRNAQNLPPPSQIAPQNWNAMTDSQKKVLLAMYESTGWNVTDAQQQYAASLPKFGSTSPQAGQVKLV